MAEQSKKFFWIKLKRNFWEDPYIKLLRRMAGGDTYVIIYLKLLVASAETDGYIYYQGAGQDLAEELAITFDESIEDVRALLAYLHAKKLILTSDTTGDLFLVASADMTGHETDSAQRVRKFRQRQQQQALQCNTHVTTSNDKLEKELEKELEIEKDILSGKPNNSSAKADTIPYQEIIDYLNKKTGKNLKSKTRDTRKVIKARFNEGFKLEDFKTVIDNKCAAWLNDATMNPFLRPLTLFGPKFDSYLNDVPQSQFKQERYYE